MKKETKMMEQTKRTENEETDRIKCRNRQNLKLRNIFQFAIVI